jgi:hypothetical protein
MAAHYTANVWGMAVTRLIAPAPAACSSMQRRQSGSKAVE